MIVTYQIMNPFIYKLKELFEFVNFEYPFHLSHVEFNLRATFSN